jgi:hypothetical protein
VDGDYRVLSKANTTIVSRTGQYSIYPCGLIERLARESRRQAESQGGTTVTLGNNVPAPNPIMPTSPESPPTVPGSPDIILPSLQALLGLPEPQDIPLGEDFGLTGFLATSTP